MAIPFDRIVRLHLAHFVAPEQHPKATQRVVVAAYLVPHPDGPVLFDTGLGPATDELEALLRPVRWPMPDVLAAAGVDPGDVRAVVNCHLHADHAGWNSLFPGVPIFSQRVEYERRREAGYMPEVVDFPGADYRLLDEEAEVLPGLTVVPTPGHTPGHQSAVLDTDRGAVVLAGQAFEDAAGFAAARYAAQLREDGTDPDASSPDWVARLREFEPVRVLFAHDEALWEPQPTLGGEASAARAGDGSGARG